MISAAMMTAKQCIRHRTSGPRMPGRAGLLARTLLTLAICSIPLVTLAQSPDRVKLLDRKEVFGEIVAASPNEVEVRDSRGESVRVPIDRIREVLLSGEPESLRTARGLLLRQDAPAALEELAKVTKEELDGASNLVLADMDFVRAAVLGRIAAAGGADLPAAEQALQGFLKAHPDSFHRYDIQEALAAVLARAAKYDEAAVALQALEKGPTSLRLRAAVGKARLFYDQRNYTEAQREFEAAEKVSVDGVDLAGRRQQAEAVLGRARCLSRLDKAAEAVALVTNLIAAVGADQREILAAAYATLGDAYRAAGGKDEDAIIAFLRVDLVHNSVPDAHAEALFNLVQLWENAKVPERSRMVRQSLESTYPDSRWTRLLATGAAAR
jgi:tetratricopeptide (TPR) repeat protein